MKIGSVGASCSRRTDRHDEASSRFSQFCKCEQSSFPKWKCV